MPDAQDIFVLSADPSQLIAAYAAADAARKASQQGVNTLAASYVSGNKEALGSLQKLSAANADLISRLNALKSAHKELTTAQTSGSAEVLQREEQYKRILGEVQTATQQAAAATVAAKKEMAAAVPDAAAGNPRLAVITAETVAEDQLRQARLRSAKAAEQTAVIQINSDVSLKSGMADKLVKYAQLARAEDELRAKMQQTFNAMQEGIPKAGEAYGVLATRLKQVTAEKEKLGKQVGITAGGLRNMNFVVGQASYAMDDFLTVLQMPGMGVIPALRSASNNVSVILTQLGPAWMAVVPAAATAALSLASNLFTAGDAADKQAKAAKSQSEELLKTISTVADYNEHVGKMRDVTNQSREAIEGLIDAEGALADMKLAESLKPLNEAAQGREQKIQEMRNRIRVFETQSIKFFNKEDREKFAKDPNSFFASDRAALAKEESELMAINAKRDRMKAERSGEIATRNIDRQFRAVDEPLKVIAKGAVGGIGPVDDSRVVNQLVTASGIKPANDAERKALEDKARDLIRGAREDAEAGERRDRAVPMDERVRRRRRMQEGEDNKRAAELRRPLAEMGRQLQEKTDEQAALENRSRRENSPGGREQLPEEKAEIQKLADVIADFRADLNEQRRAIERQIEAMKKNTEATFANTAAAGDDGPGAGRVGLNPVGSE